MNVPKAAYEDRDRQDSIIRIAEIVARSTIVLAVVVLATFANNIGGIEVSSDALFTLYGTALGYTFGAVGEIGRAVRRNGNGNSRN